MVIHSYIHCAARSARAVAATWSMSSRRPPGRQAHHLGDRALVVGDGAQAERAQHGVEGPAGEVKRLGVAYPQVRVAAQGGRALAGDAEHGR